AQPVPVEVEEGELGQVEVVAAVSFGRGGGGRGAGGRVLLRECRPLGPGGQLAEQCGEDVPRLLGLWFLSHFLCQCVWFNAFLFRIINVYLSRSLLMTPT